MIKLISNNSKLKVGDIFLVTGYKHPLPMGVDGMVGQTCKCDVVDGHFIRASWPLSGHIFTLDTREIDWQYCSKEFAESAGFMG